MGEEEVGKLFIGGVDKAARQDEFQSLFQSKGELEDIILMKDPEMPDRNRGFGFVKFKDPACAEQLLRGTEPLMLNGKALDVKRCRQRDSLGGPKSMGGGMPADSPNKVFVGGLPQTCNEDNLRACFSAYGEVQHVKIMKDRNTGNLRGFAFISFTAAEPVRKLIDERYVQFEGKNVEVKAAEHRYRFQGPDGQAPAPGGFGYGTQQPQQGYGGQNNWQQPPAGGQGDAYGYNAGGWGAQQQQAPQQPQQQQMGGMWGQQPQPMGNYGNQGGYSQRPAANQWSQNNQGYSQGYPNNQQPSTPQYGGSSYGQAPQGGYGDQYSQQGGYGNNQPPQQQAYGGGGYAPQGGYGGNQPPAQQGYNPPPQQSGGGYSQQGYGGGYGGNAQNYGQPTQQGAPPVQDPNSSGGPMRQSGYGQRVGNNTHGYHPYGK